MNSSKRRQQQPNGPLFNKPVQVPAPPTPSPADELRGWRRRRAMVVGTAAALLVLVGIALFLLWPRPAETVAPVAPPAPQVPVAVVPEPAQASAPIGGSGLPCAAIEGLPVIEGATCIEQKRDNDDGVQKLENTYVTPRPADEVRRIFEGAFQQNGWQTSQSSYDDDDQTWKYEVTQGARRVDLRVETEQENGATFTRIKIEEK